MAKEQYWGKRYIKILSTITEHFCKSEITSKQNV